MQKILPQVQSLELKYKNLFYQIEYFIRPGNKATILFVHGLGGSKENYWESLKISELDDYCLIAFDNPGIGSSTYYDDHPLNVDDLVEVTALFIEKMKLKNFILVGASMGGLITLNYLKRKDAQKVLAYINIEGNFMAEDCMFSSKVISHSYEHFSNEVFLLTIYSMRRHESAGYRIIANNLELNTNVKSYYTYSFQTVEYSNTGQLLDQYLNMNIPRLFIYGERNEALSYLPKLRAAGLKLESIPWSDHFIFYDNPKGLYQAISKFLNALQINDK